MEAIRGKWLTVDKRANIPEHIAKAVRILCGHKVTLIIEGEDVKIVAIEESKQSTLLSRSSLPGSTVPQSNLTLPCHEAG